MARIDRQLTKLANRETELHAQLVEHADDYGKLAELDAKLKELTAQKDALEEEWLEAASTAE
jgi:ATP-binding cassette subfamily F protein uup